MKSGKRPFSTFSEPWQENCAAQPQFSLKPVTRNSPNSNNVSSNNTNSNNIGDINRSTSDARVAARPEGGERRLAASLSSSCEAGRPLLRTASGGVRLAAPTNVNASPQRPPPPPRAASSKTSSRSPSGSGNSCGNDNSCGNLNACINGNGPARIPARQLRTPLVARRVSFDTSAVHTSSPSPVSIPASISVSPFAAAACIYEPRRRKSMPLLPTQSQPRESPSPTAPRTRLQRLGSYAHTTQKTTTTNNNNNNNNSKLQRSFSTSPLCSSVGAAVGSSGQKPFIRRMSRVKFECLSIPSLSTRGLGDSAGSMNSTNSNNSNSNTTSTLFSSTSIPFPDVLGTNESNSLVPLLSSSSACLGGRIDRRAMKENIKARRKSPSPSPSRPPPAAARQPQEKEKKYPSPQKALRKSFNFSRASTVLAVPSERPIAATVNNISKFTTTNTTNTTTKTASTMAAMNRKNNGSGPVASGVTFVRQVSKLCLMVLEERDRRLVRQKTLREEELKAEEKENEHNDNDETVVKKTYEENKEKCYVDKCPQLLASSFSHCVHNNNNNNNNNKKCSEGADNGEDRVNSSAAVLECVRTVLEKRRSTSCLHDTETSLHNPTSSRVPLVRSAIPSEGNSHDSTNGVTSSSGKCTEDTHEVTAANNNNRETEEENNNSNKDDDDDDSWWGDEDPWWCFDALWCGPLDRTRQPPPSFVPPLDFSCIHADQDEMMLTDSMYAIPMPTLATTYRGGGVNIDNSNNNNENCSNSYSSTIINKKAFAKSSSHSCVQSFTDTSDALAGGRGVEREAKQEVRRMRIQLLLLETHERRERRIICQEEGAECKLLTEEKKMMKKGRESY